jgi:hypothetical protein
MPALVAGIHDFLPRSKKVVDGRDKPGHDAEVESSSVNHFAIASYTTLPPTIVISGLMSLISSAGTVR